MRVYCSQNHENLDNSRFCTLCGEALVLSVGQVIENRYEIGRILGQGGFGRTYLAIDRQKSREICVLKEFAPQVSHSQALQKAKELFDREANVLKTIKHPQIPCFHNSLQAKIGTRDFFFLVQDYIDGNNYYQLLEQRHKQGKSFSEEEVVNLLHQVLPILSYIHSLNIIHRDISPDNLICRNGDNLPMLIDFGGVKQLPAHQGFWKTQLGANLTLLGKKGYAPEEQLVQGKVYKNSDLYSLAVTALVLITGKEPQKLYDSYDGVWLWGKEILISRKLENVFKKMLAYTPSDRYQTAEQVIRDLPPISISSTSIHNGNNVMPNPPNNPNPYITKLKTMVVAPAKNISSGVHGKTALLVQQIPMPEWLRPFAISFIITTGITLTGVGIWATGNFVVNGVKGINLPKVETPSIPGISKSNNSERTNKDIFDRLTELQISNVFFTNTVNEIFYGQKPELNGRELTNKPEDNVLREEWNNIADNLLSKLEEAKLSEKARKKIGNYSQRDSERWDQLAKQGRLGKYKSFQELRLDTYQKFEPLFPGQERGKLNQPTFLQIWYAIADDIVSQGSK